MLDEASPAEVVGLTKAVSWVNLKQVVGSAQTPPTWDEFPGF